MNVLYTPETENYLYDLAYLLYEKNYFGYFSSAWEYVQSLIKEMETTIHMKRKWKAPVYFSRYGKNMQYITCPRNKNTTWYFFFTRHANDVYVIPYITNNHVAGHLLD